MQEFEIEQIKEIIKQHGYEYKEILKNDSFSYIFLCQHRSNGQKFVIKMSIKQQIVEDESKNLMELCHPYIIKLYDIFEDDVNEYLVLEYCPNGTIEQKGKLPYKKFVRYSKQILEAIKFCHSKNIALRDINPKNIYIDQYDQIKLTNFGMAKEFQNDETSNEKCSSLMFLAPELFLNKDVCPFKTDIWALGVTFFYMETGSFPFKSSSIEKTKQMIERGDVNYSKYEMHPQIRFLISRMSVEAEGMITTTLAMFLQQIGNDQPRQ